MTKLTLQTVLSIVRTIATFAATFFIGQNVFGNPLTSENWEIIVGVIVGFISIVWGIVDKTANVEKVESAIRSILISGGGLLVAWGKLKNETFQAILGLVTGLLPILLSYFSKAKVVQIAQGKVSTIAETGKVTKNVA